MKCQIILLNNPKHAIKCQIILLNNPKHAIKCQIIIIKQSYTCNKMSNYYY